MIVAKGIRTYSGMAERTLNYFPLVFLFQASSYRCVGIPQMFIMFGACWQLNEHSNTMFLDNGIKSALKTTSFVAYTAARGIIINTAVTGS